MDELVTFNTGLGAIKQVMPLFRALLEKAPKEGASPQFTGQFNDAVIEMQQAVIDAQEMVLSAQIREDALNARIRELEQSNVHEQMWQAERSRYCLKDLGKPTGMVYSLREEFISREEPGHHICTRCYEDGIKSILQPVKGISPALFCPRCIG